VPHPDAAWIDRFSSQLVLLMPSLGYEAAFEIAREVYPVAQDLDPDEVAGNFALDQ